MIIVSYSKNYSVLNVVMLNTFGYLFILHKNLTIIIIILETGI